ncbi:asparagine synthase (glutamine-hydrolyzing) [Vibrio vulnificus]|uniref:asparagine synthase (glutamine-hydrolyzing) n=1 Tax=Vibrio vulnificus TaxID=672 RepID=UPI000CD02AE3|nr:asparagine synthase (glutamine-hydrolyzing) [Vibrio vulnificus]MCA3986512.1 asparagine synthase (glutamine-hydrolyzing) [Vibrio vulnificus]MDK2603650.1 asparagine synthase (glutamine-hydrolyzing) [Vibrio vulnificus]MDK2624342.1 asparagine synthase (glutamine-hydrolyzing) [Vibrio vulnificus]MDK2719637.1 asparagine synthase (glutamine-hydrolyzing) [Vibrio vulnificus]POC57194.1 asparagine synthase (glutamine-hydrolyzing) [Vibrio vulnificus]
MCGLVAVISKNRNINLHNLVSMNDAIEHRGPNDEGYFFLNTTDNQLDEKKAKFLECDSISVSIGFAHRRLSIQDLSDLGHQPMCYRDRYWIVYNGEVYNHIEIKEELEEKGHTFKSHSDTEVILAAYSEWGEDCVKKFNGMWAFLIFDSKDGTVFISRDRFGIKPLYYYESEESLVFASEIKSLMEYEAIITEPCKSYCEEVIDSGSQEYIKQTAFENIYRFDFSSSAIINLNDTKLSFLESRFWDYEVNLSNEKFCEKKAKKIADDYYELLKDAVRLRLRADVPFGSALSGGLDSTAIVYLIEEILKEQDSTYKQQTFSTVYDKKEDKECDESYYIKLITDKLGIKSNTIVPTEGEFLELHNTIIKHWENPMAGTGMAGISTYSLINSSNVVVTLDGQGADEQQAGYLYYISNYLYNLPFYEALKQSKSLLDIPKAKKPVMLGVSSCILRTFLGKKLSQQLLSKILKRDMSRFLLPLNELLKKESNSNLINLIHYSDSRSMLFSIESRMPFMDYRLVEFTAKVPACYKIHRGWTKYFARLAFSNRLPDEICWRKDKMGWPVPDKRWFSGALNEFLNGRVKNCNFISELSEQQRNSDVVKSLGVDKSIRLLNIASWKQNFFGDKT